MANLSKTTNNHEEIQKWAEERGGKPSHVKSTGSKDDIGILRIDFPGYSGEGSLEEITWDQFFEKFDERGLSLIYQEETAGGERSNFNKLVSAETAEENEKGRSRSRKSAGKKGSSGRASARRKSSGAARKSSPAKKAAKTSGSKTSSKSVSAKKTSGRGAGGKKSGSNRGAGAQKHSPNEFRGEEEYPRKKERPC